MTPGWFETMGIGVLDGEGFAVRVDGDPSSLSSGVRGALAEVDDSVPPFSLQSMRAVAAGRIEARVAVSIISGLFGVMALLLAVLGIYGLVLQDVLGRRRELGIRLAVGADPRGLFGRVMLRTRGLTMSGVLAGIAVSAFLVGSIRGLLFGIEPTDPLTFVGVSVVLLAAGCLAGLVPARRASATDPGASLRAD